MAMSAPGRMIATGEPPGSQVEDGDFDEGCSGRVAAVASANGLNSSGEAALVCIPASTARVNVVYRRSDGRSAGSSRRPHGFDGGDAVLARFLLGTLRGRTGFTTYCS